MTRAQLAEMLDLLGSVVAVVDAVHTEEIDDEDLAHWWSVATLAIGEIENILTSISGANRSAHSGP